MKRGLERERGEVDRDGLYEVISYPGLGGGVERRMTDECGWMGVMQVIVEPRLQFGSRS